MWLISALKCLLLLLTKIVIHTSRRTMILREERRGARMAPAVCHCDTIGSLVVDGQLLYSSVLTVLRVPLPHLPDVPKFWAVVELQ